VRISRVRFGLFTAVVFVALTALSFVPYSHSPRAAGAAADLLPDLMPIKWALYENDVVTWIQSGHTHLRLTQITVNIGDGKLHLYGGPDNGDGTQDVLQRIFRDDMTYWDRLAGLFVFHPSHNHIHFEGWAIYRLREILPGEGVGPIIASGDKTSFCVYDNTLHDPTLPGYTGQEFSGCSSVLQGLGVGWGDTYDLSTPGQNIDITGVPDGEYWLESEVDPDDDILESDETNNIARVKVTIGSPSPINPDPYEPNQNFSDLVGRPIGGFNSPVLGPCAPLLQIDDLTIHDSASHEDYFRFYMPATGGSDDEVRIDFLHAEGDLRLRLYNASESLLATANNSGEWTQNFESISLNGYGTGWYYVRVDEAGGQTSPGYQLTIDPPANGAPSVTCVNPPSGDVEVIQAVETYQVTWNASDPESNETWVTVYINTSPVLDGNEILRFTSLNTPGSQGFYILDTVGVPLGTYYVYCSITDGGTVTGDWSSGTITVIDDATGVGPHPGVALRHLLPNAPNPFNPSTQMNLLLETASIVSWRIYNVSGQLVRTIENGRLEAGPHVRAWNGRDDAGRQVPSGVYMAVVDTPDFHESQKLVLIK
jgi:hypothetical protein